MFFSARSDFMEGTMAGAWISMLAAALICMLLLLVSARLATPAASAPADVLNLETSLYIIINVLVLQLQELSSFMSLQKDEELVIDNSPEGDLLKMSFNIR
jgi:hypothetical protein